MDLIDRQAAIDALSTPHGILYPIRTVEELPSVQPEVVYCKKCKHWTRTCGDEQWGLGDCDVFDKHLVMCNGYCAWAERRTDE